MKFRFEFRYVSFRLVGEATRLCSSETCV